MTQKRKIQNIVDASMILLLPLLMAYSLIGEAVHEWAGIAMSLLFVAHHALNWRWYKSILKGHYSPLRSIKTILNLVLAVDMIALPVSGLLMAKHSFSFLNLDIDISTVRLIHLIASYWGFVLMSLHLGFHWNMIQAMLQKAVKIKNKSVFYTVVSKLLVIVLAGYGVYAFMKRQIGDYLLLTKQFVFFDYSEPHFLFLLDYFCVIGLFAVLGYYIIRILQIFFNNHK